MKKIVTAFILISFFAACNNGSGDNEKPKNDSLTVLKPEIAEPSGPPATVKGGFAGEVPCKDCEKTERFINLTETTYDISEHYAGRKIKSAPIGSYKGKCTQLNGFITLNDNDDKPFQWYKIISKDSIEMVNVKRTAAKLDKRYFLVRKDGQKLVK